MSIVLRVGIDGDIFRYRCAFAAERTEYLVELTNASGYKEWTKFDTKKEADAYGERVTKGVQATVLTWSRKEVQPVENALQITKSCLEQTLEAIANHYGQEVEYKIYLSGPKNFRDTLAVTKPYKGNRADTPKPIHYKAVGEYLSTVWNAVTTEGVEADDEISIQAAASRKENIKYVVVSNDKDLTQIPGFHYDWTTKEFFEVSPQEAKTQFFTQLLTGDATDNIPGLPGVGPATAKKILADCKSPEDMVDACWHAYWETDILKLNEAQTREYFLEMAELVYIRKNPDWGWIDSKEGEYFKERYAA